MCINIMSLRNAVAGLGVLCTGAWSEGGDKCGKEEQEGKKKMSAWKFVSQLEGSYYTVGNNERPFFFGTLQMY